MNIYISKKNININLFIAFTFLFNPYIFHLIPEMKFQIFYMQSNDNIVNAIMK